MLLKFVYTNVRVIQLRSIVSLIYGDCFLLSRVLFDTKVHAHVIFIPMLCRVAQTSRVSSHASR